MKPHVWTVGDDPVVVGPADLAAPGAGMTYLAAWPVMAGLVFLPPGVESKGRSPEELDEALAWLAAARVRAREARAMLGQV
ncbi:MAG TPA: hypothetical protein VL614_02385 [Acetobacteraceae bacterium]|nr:hypothetical protein [Acetobacteraceae bacterium]